MARQVFVFIRFDHTSHSQIYADTNHSPEVEKKDECSPIILAALQMLPLNMPVFRGMTIMSLLKWLVRGNSHLCVIWYSNIIVPRVHPRRTLRWRTLVVMVRRSVNGLIWHGRELRLALWSPVLFHWRGRRIRSGNSRLIWHWRELATSIASTRGTWRRLDLFGRICNNWRLGPSG